MEKLININQDIDKLKESNAYILSWLVIYAKADLNEAEVNRCEKKIKYLLSKKNYNINYPCPNGWTPMHYACKMSKIPIIKVLLRHGGMLNSPNNHEMQTPIDLLDDQNIKNEIINYYQSLKFTQETLIKIEYKSTKIDITNPAKNFILSLIQASKKATQELENVNKIARDINDLKKMYNLTSNNTLVACGVDLPILISYFCEQKQLFYQSLVTTVLANNDIELVDRIYRRMWIDSFKIEDTINYYILQINQVLMQHAKTKNKKSVTKEDFLFIIHDIQLFYQNNMRLFKEHISFGMENEIRNTQLIRINTREYKISYNFKTFLLEIEEALVEVDSIYKELDNTWIDCYPFGLLELGLANLYTEYLNKSKLYLDSSQQTLNIEMLNDDKKVSKYFTCFSSILEKIKFYHDVFKWCLTQQKLNDTTTNLENTSVIKVNEYKQRLADNLQAWKNQVEENKKQKKQVTANKKLCAELEKNKNKYLVKYDRLDIINQNFVPMTKKLDNGILHAIFSGNKQYTINDIQNFICVLGGKYKVSSKNHVIYFIPDLYAAGSTFKYITGSIAFPSKSNSKNDQYVDENYILHLKNNLIEAGFNKILTQIVTNDQNKFKLK